MNEYNFLYCVLKFEKYMHQPSRKTTPVCINYPVTLISYVCLIFMKILYVKTLEKLNLSLILTSIYITIIIVTKLRNIHLDLVPNFSLLCISSFPLFAILFFIPYNGENRNNIFCLET